jgi:dihydrofolate reductase
MAADRIIGAHGTLPWRFPADLQQFKAVTMGHHLLMGRTTFDSIGRPLPGRTSIVLTRDPAAAIPGAIVAHSLDEAIARATGENELFVIGGEQVFRATLPIADRIRLTELDLHVDGDTVFPALDPGDWLEVSSEPLADPQFDARLRVLDRRRA